MHSDIRILTLAYKFSANKHKKQRRKGIQETPYVNHTIDVANLLANTVEGDDYILLLAAILHDTIEDTDTNYEELELFFGSEVACIVKEVSDNMLLSKEERKKLQIEKAPTLSQRAKLIKIADKVCNIQDMLKTRYYWTNRQKLKYISWSDEVVAHCRGINKKLDQEFDNALGTAADTIGWKKS
jgi:GTP diphosphokinase / guanosine-3',5'-bis(diphosphate) 3'-diphosphatase